MVSAHRRQRGNDTQNMVAGWFRENGWPHAESTGSGRGGTDVLGMPGLCVEVKARRDFTPTVWLAQHDGRSWRANGLAVPSLVIWRPDGYGPARLADWPMMLRLGDGTRLLRNAGYGDG
jgi:hypothetical protein